MGSFEMQWLHELFKMKSCSIRMFQSCMIELTPCFSKWVMRFGEDLFLDVFCRFFIERYEKFLWDGRGNSIFYFILWLSDSLIFLTLLCRVYFELESTIKKIVYNLHHKNPYSCKLISILFLKYKYSIRSH